MNWQPYLIGSRLRLRPLADADFDALYTVASDPKIWEQHPDRERYRRANFEAYFRSGLESRGALVVIDMESGAIIGSSRYTEHDAVTSSVKIGFTFLTRDYWGDGFNRELKTLMLAYAFQTVETVYFGVGKNNLRSRRALTKIGAKEVTDAEASALSNDLNHSVLYRINRHEGLGDAAHIAFVQPRLETARLDLDPVEATDAEDLWQLFQDPELYRFIPSDPPTLEEQRLRCDRWSKRRSPDGRELWLNWIARDRATKRTIGHLQAGVDQAGVATIAYVIGRDQQGRGYATEALEAVFAYLRDRLGVCEAKAWADTRNVASHRLAGRLGMKQVGLIRNADFFKGAHSDEFVFSRMLD